MQGGGVRCMPDERPGEGTNLLCRYQAPNKNGHGRVCREILVDIHSSDDHQSEEEGHLQQPNQSFRTMQHLRIIDSEDRRGGAQEGRGGCFVEWHGIAILSKHEPPSQRRTPQQRKDGDVLDCAISGNGSKFHPLGTQCPGKVVSKNHLYGLEDVLFHEKNLVYRVC